MVDLIERYKITANLPSVMMNYCNRFNNKQIELITEMIYELENSIESVDAQPVRRGKWEDCSNGSMCSCCCRDVTYETPFCPYCGADMRGKED